jgi:predicted RNA-binding protein YlqC (UPF0109 family)
MEPDSSETPRDPRSLLEFLVRRLVADQDAVSVIEQAAEGAVVLRVHVAEDERGKVIGRNGRVVRALRSIIRASGVRSQERILVEIDT